MNRNLIQKRMEDLKKEQEEASKHIQDLDVEKQKTINEILIRNGRILELEKLLQDDPYDKHRKT